MINDPRIVNTRSLFVERIILKSESLPDLLGNVAGVVFDHKLKLWEIDINTTPDDDDGLYYAILTLEGFVNP